MWLFFPQNIVLNWVVSVYFYLHKNMFIQCSLLFFVYMYNTYTHITVHGFYNRTRQTQNTDNIEVTECVHKIKFTSKLGFFKTEKKTHLTTTNIWFWLKQTLLVYICVFVLFAMIYFLYLFLCIECVCVVWLVICWFAIQTERWFCHSMWSKRWNGIWRFEFS